MSKKSLAYNSFMNLLLSLSQYIFPMISFAYVSRIIGAVGLGKVAFADSYVSYFSMIAALGIPVYGIRACAEVSQNKSKLSEVTFSLLAINIITTGISCLLFMFSILIVPQLREDKEIFLIMGFNIIFCGLQCQWLYQGIEKYGYITKRTILFRLLSFSFIVLIVKEDKDIFFYCIGLLLVSGGAFISNILYMHKYISIKSVKSIKIKKHLRPIVYFLASNIATSIYTSMDTVMLGFMTGDQEIGYYSAANKIYRVCNSIIAAAFAVFLPRITAYLSLDKFEDVKNLQRKGFDIVEFMAFPISIYLAVFSESIIKFICGEGFQRSESILGVMSIANIVIGYSGVIINLILIPLNKERYSSMAVMVGGIANLALNVMLIPILGALGAAVATVITEVTVLSVAFLFSKGDCMRVMRVSNIKNVVRNCIAIIGAAILCRRVVVEYSAVKYIIASILYAMLVLVYMLITKNSIMKMIIRRVKGLYEHTGA